MYLVERYPETWEVKNHIALKGQREGEAGREVMPLYTAPVVHRAPAVVFLESWNLSLYIDSNFYQIFSIFTSPMLSQTFPIPFPDPPLLPSQSLFLVLVFRCTYKVCKTKGPFVPMMADQAIFCYICSQRHELWGYWLVILLFHLQGCRLLQLLGYFLQLLHRLPSNRLL